MNEEELLLEEYRNLHRERWERSRRAWLSLSIFIAGSFILFLEAMKNRAELGISNFFGLSGFFSLMIFAIGLVAISWLIEFTTIKNNDSALRSIIEIEDLLHFRHPQIRQKREEKSFWFRIRRLGGTCYFSVLFWYTFWQQSFSIRKRETLEKISSKMKHAL